MTITWESDTCACIIEFDEQQLKITNIIQQCKSHVNIEGSDLLSCPASQYSKQINLTITYQDPFHPTQTELQNSINVKSKNYIGVQ